MRLLYHWSSGLCRTISWHHSGAAGPRLRWTLARKGEGHSRWIASKPDWRVARTVVSGTPPADIDGVSVLGSYGMVLIIEVPVPDRSLPYLPPLGLALTRLTSRAPLAGSG